MNDMELVDRCWDTHNTSIAINPPDRTHDDIETWFKYEEDTNCITICGRCNIKAPILTVLSVFAENDLLPTFIDTFDSLTLLKQFSNFRFLTNIKIKMPTLISNREVITYGIGMACEEDKSILMAFKTPTDFKNPDDQDYLGVKIPKESDHSRVYINFGFYLLTVVDENTTEFVMASNIDPNIAIVPMFIINTFMKEVGYYICSDFKKRIEKL